MKFKTPEDNKCSKRAQRLVAALVEKGFTWPEDGNRAGQLCQRDLRVALHEKFGMLIQPWQLSRVVAGISEPRMDLLVSLLKLAEKNLDWYLESVEMG